MGFFDGFFGGSNNDWAKELGNDMHNAAASGNAEATELLQGFLDTEMAQDILKRISFGSAVSMLPTMNVPPMSVKDRILGMLDRKIADGTEDEKALAEKIKKSIQKRNS